MAKVATSLRTANGTLTFRATSPGLHKFCFHRSPQSDQAIGFVPLSFRIGTSSADEAAAVAAAASAETIPVIESAALLWKLEQQVGQPLNCGVVPTGLPTKPFALQDVPDRPPADLHRERIDESMAGSTLRNQRCHFVLVHLTDT